MKKILMTVAIAVSCFAVKAQDVTTVTSSPLNFGLNLDDIITMNVTFSNLNPSANFNTSALYDINTWGVGTASPSLGHATFTVSSNRYYDVSTRLVSLVWSQNGHAYDATYDVNKTMAASVIGYATDYTAPLTGDVTMPTFVAPDHATQAPVSYAAFNVDYPVLHQCGYGQGSTFDLHEHGMPGWLYTGGLYTGTFTVTATQL